jgi:predicted dehydrogenase
MSEKVRVGVIGLGFGQFLVRTLAHMNEVRLVAVADRVPDIVPGGLDEYARRYGATAYKDSSPMLDNEQLDAVVVAVSPRWRKDIIEQAATHGLPMFIEKPWATDLAHAHELAAIVERHTASVMVGFSFRYHPAVVRLRQLIDSELGPAWMLNGDYVFGWLPPADSWVWDPHNGNGFFNENSCHLFDAVCYLLGKPVSVMAEAANFTGQPSEDAAILTLRFESGAMATLSIGGIGAGARHDFPRLDVIAEHGQAHLTGREHMWEALRWASRGSTTEAIFSAPPEVLGTTRYTHAMQHFVECIQTGASPTATIQDGILAVVLAEAVYKSARTGQKVYIEV